MRRKYWMLPLIIGTMVSMATDQKTQPVTKKDEIIENLHGVQVEDPYRWLENQDAPEVRTWIDQQNAYTDHVAGNLPIRDVVKKELFSMANLDSYGMPTKKGDRYFFSRRLKDDDLSVLCMRQGPNGEDQVLIDPHPMSKDNSISVNMGDISKDGTLLLYAIRKNGEDQLEFRIRDINKGEDLEDRLPYGLYFSTFFAADSKSFYYVKRGEEGPRLFHHVLGTDASKDQLIFGEGFGSERILIANIDDTGNKLMIAVSEGSSGNRDLYIMPTRGKAKALQIAKSEDGWISLVPIGNRLLARTNINAPNFKITEVPLDKMPASPSQWPTVVPERKDAVLKGFSAAGGKLYLNYMKDVVTHTEIYNPEGKNLGTISFPSIGNISGIWGEWGENEAFFSYTSVHIPGNIYRYDTAKDKSTIWFETRLPVDTSNIVVKQEWFTSKDGEKVPMFLTYRKDMVQNGDNPTLLYGYGGFRVNLNPSFNSQAIVLASRGGIHAMINLRGGSEFGERWHQSGMKEHKQNTFNDLFAAAEHLIKNKYTNPKRLGVFGGSNGGLLVGAAITQRPDLFNAAASLYPLHDMLRFHKFLMGSYWISEYGDPDQAEDFAYIRAYSPYHNVKKGTHYPATIFVSGDADTRVAPLHARKMAAMVQERQGGDAPILLQYDTKAGHVGGGSKSHSIDNSSLWYSFLLHHIGIK